MAIFFISSIRCVCNCNNDSLNSRNNSKRQSESKGVPSGPANMSRDGDCSPKRVTRSLMASNSMSNNPCRSDTSVSISLNKDSNPASLSA